MRKDRKRVSYKEAIALFDRLAALSENNQMMSQASSAVLPYLSDSYQGTDTDWNALCQELAFATAVMASNTSFGRLPEIGNEELNLAKKDFAANAQSIGDIIQQTNGSILFVSDLFDKQVYNWETSPLSNCQLKAEGCLRNTDRIENWFGFYGLLNKLKEKRIEPFLLEAISKKTMENAFAPLFKKSFLKKWIDHIIASEPILSGFTRISQDQAVQRFSEKDKNHFEICRAEIRSHLSAKRPSLDLLAPNSSVSLLLREGEKKRKLKTIRTLMSEAGDLIQTIKPCFLMSPLSISTFLSDSSVHFDVVIFDEASQIFPQDAIGAIYRGKQLIVVGDSKQMPPSNFFNASSDTDDDESGDIGDFESILDICSASMPQLRLKWHYRSKFEQLIAFSNKNFYENELVTFPSSHKQADGLGVTYFPVNGVFDHKSKTNFEEAKAVVNLIYEHIDKYPDRSLGVVAFSISQQSLIDSLLSRERRSRPEKEPFFNGDKKEPFFIKNLETVQGDERDTIIFSVAYGKDGTGRVMHNFGPLNRMGGERRLNVAVTRAKYNVILVSSMHYTDIDLKRTQSKGAALLKEYLDYAENGDIALKRNLTVSPHDSYDSDFEMDVCSFLREKGFDVDTQVGCSGFRIDLGLKRPGTSDYALAIECDGASYHSSKTARDRDRLRQEILETMGWKFYRIWSTDWYRNGAIEKENLLKAARNALNHPVESTPVSQPRETKNRYEYNVLAEKNQFPTYKCADIESIYLHSTGTVQTCFVKIVKDVLEVEAPLSEEWLLKRVSFLFDRERVTKVVRDEYESLMTTCHLYGIRREKGFLYLNNQPVPQLRLPGKSGRDIKYIAPEELANGMYKIIKTNVAVDKEGLFRLTANQLGVTRLGPDIMEQLEKALVLLSPRLVFKGGSYSIA